MVVFISPTYRDQTLGSTSHVSRNVAISLLLDNMRGNHETPMISLSLSKSIGPVFHSTIVCECLHLEWFCDKI